jgi:hypothetical protein
MDVNSKKLARTSKFIYFCISLTLCIFLILLAGKIIRDLDSMFKPPHIENFEDAQALAGLNVQNRKFDSETDVLDSKKYAIEKAMRLARDKYQNEKESFNNWIETRKTLGSPEKDNEVINRANKLDDFYKVEQDWAQQLDLVQEQINAARSKQKELQASIYDLNKIAYQKYYAALKRHELKVFLVRLLFVGPVLALGIYFFVKRRNHKLYPLFFGFTLFSVYTFFVGLLPYIPSYGGYVRYSVGILITVFLGYYAINHIKTFLEQKQAELKASAQERAKKVQTDTAEKALENHFCPSCGKDFFYEKLGICSGRRNGWSGKNYGFLQTLRNAAV